MYVSQLWRFINTSNNNNNNNLMYVASFFKPDLSENIIVAYPIAFPANRVMIGMIQFYYTAGQIQTEDRCVSNEYDDEEAAPTIVWRFP